jgi:histidinol-phosphate aminotransferase
MKEYWSPRIRNSTPYVPGEQPRTGKYIKLNTNENPYPPSPRVLEALRGAVDESLRLYPDPECWQLRQAIAERNGITPEEVFVGNGSDEVLAFSFQAFFDPSKPIRFPDVTYTFYAIFADFFGLRHELVTLDKEFRLSVEDLFHSPGGVVLANPNAPTGWSVSREEVRQVLEHNRDTVVLVDEAYVDFGGETVLPLIREYDNLLVVRTLSKSASLAGIRVGYAMGSENLMNALRCVRDSINSYTVDRLAQAGAEAAIRDVQWMRENTAKLTSTRAWVLERLNQMGFLVYPSATNFFFVHHDSIPAKALMEALRAQGVLVRHFDKPRICDFLRVSIGTDREMEELCRVLETILQGV